MFNSFNCSDESGSPMLGCKELLYDWCNIIWNQQPHVIFIILNIMEYIVLNVLMIRVPTTPMANVTHDAMFFLL